MRRKSFSLVLLILIIISVLAIVVLSIHLINKPHNDDNNNKSDNQQTENLNTVDDSGSSSLNNNTTSNVNSTTQVPTNTVEPAPVSENNVITLNNHSYKFGSDVSAEESEDTNGKKVIKYSRSGKKYSIIYGSIPDNKIDDLKNEANLSEYIETEYKVKLTSGVKAGNLSNLDLVICSISENGNAAYLLFTPLKNSEVAYAKIYNSENIAELVPDLNDSLNEVSSIISSIQ